MDRTEYSGTIKKSRAKKEVMSGANHPTVEIRGNHIFIGKEQINTEMTKDISQVSQKGLINSNSEVNSATMGYAWGDIGVAVSISVAITMVVMCYCVCCCAACGLLMGGVRWATRIVANMQGDRSRDPEDPARKTKALIEQ